MVEKEGDRHFSLKINSLLKKEERESEEEKETFALLWALFTLLITNWMGIWCMCG